MSVNNLLDSGNPAESWKALRLASLVIDNDFTLSEDAVKGLSGSFPAFNLANTVILANGILVDYSSPCDIPQNGITWGPASPNIIVDESGYYSININIAWSYIFPGPVSDITVNLIFTNATDSYDVASAVQVIPSGSQDPFTLSINRIAKLIAGKNYNLMFEQDVATNGVLTSSNLSYINIVKLF